MFACEAGGKSDKSLLAKICLNKPTVLVEHSMGLIDRKVLEGKQGKKQTYIRLVGQ